MTTEDILITIIRCLIIFVHLFSYTFNFLLIFLIVRRKALKTKVYILNMVFAEIIINICQHALVEAKWFTDNQDLSSSYISQLFGFVYLTATQFRYLLTFLMSINRLVVVISPSMTIYFTQEMIVFYAYFLWGLIIVSNALYILNDCSFIFDRLGYHWEMKCILWNAPEYIANAYYILFVTCFFNICVVFYSKLRRARIFHCTVARISQTAAETRRVNERSFVIHAIIITIVMAIDAIYNVIRRSYIEQFTGMNVVLQVLFGAVNVYLNSLVNFFIYFMFHKLIRKHIINIVFCKPKYIPDAKTLAANSSSI